MFMSKPDNGRFYLGFVIKGLFFSRVFSYYGDKSEYGDLLDLSMLFYLYDYFCGVYALISYYCYVEVAFVETFFYNLLSNLL